MMAVSSNDGAVYLVDIADPAHPLPLGRIAPTQFELRFAEVRRVGFDTSGRTLAVGSLNGIYLWDITDPHNPHSLGPELPGSLPTGTGMLNAFSQMTVSPDGRYIAAGGATSGKNNHAVLLWDIKDRRHPQLTAELGGPSDLINSVAFSRNGHTLAGAGYDHSVWAWDITDHNAPRLIGQLQQHTSNVNSVAFADGSLLASGSNDDTVHLWDTDISQVAKQACLLSGSPSLETIWNRYAPQVHYSSPCR
jgi:WD40 repeat protein